jgi:hypothetical protein
VGVGRKWLILLNIPSGCLVYQAPTTPGPHAVIQPTRLTIPSGKHCGHQLNIPPKTIIQLTETTSALCAALVFLRAASCEGTSFLPTTITACTSRSDPSTTLFRHCLCMDVKIEALKATWVAGSSIRDHGAAGLPS